MLLPVGVRQDDADEPAEEHRTLGSYRVLVQRSFLKARWSVEGEIYARCRSRRFNGDHWKVCKWRLERVKTSQSGESQDRATSFAKTCVMFLHALQASHVGMENRLPGADLFVLSGYLAQESMAGTSFHSLSKPRKRTRSCNQNWTQNFTPGPKTAV